MKCNRREVLTTAGAAWMALNSAQTSFTPAQEQSRDSAQPVRFGGSGLPTAWRALRKFDAHNHIFGTLHGPQADWSQVESLIEAAERLGIEKLCCSRPITGGKLAGNDEVRATNDSILAAMRRYPERIAGFCFIQPGNGPAALAEIQRCLEAGMIGVKLYNQYRYSDPMVYPVAERCIEHGIPLLGHSAHLTDARSKAAQPNTSDSLDFCQLSGRYPELILILGHINGGGDWEWAIKGLRDCPNVHVDTSGSVQESNTLEMCVQELGHHRVLFATDLTMEGGVGKILSASLTDEQREDIFWRNLQKILERRRT